MSRCPHTAYYREVRSADLLVGEIALQVDLHRCVDCGTYLPLGPATMTPDVADELRASAIATSSAARIGDLSALEIDWLVHGDSPAHSDERWPETREEHAALLAHWMREHDAIKETP